MVRTSEIQIKAKFAECSFYEVGWVEVSDTRGSRSYASLHVRERLREYPPRQAEIEAKGDQVQEHHDRGPHKPSSSVLAVLRFSYPRDPIAQLLEEPSSGTTIIVTVITSRNR